MKSSFYDVLQFIMNVFNDLLDTIADNWLLSMLLFVPVAGILTFVIFELIADNLESDGISFSSSNSENKQSGGLSLKSFNSIQKTARANSVRSSVHSSKLDSVHGRASHGAVLINDNKAGVTTSDLIKFKRAKNAEAEKLKREEEKKRAKQQADFDKNFNTATKINHYINDKCRPETRTVKYNKETGEIYSDKTTTHFYEKPDNFFSRGEFDNSSDSDDN